jgi:hypothetical protein
MKLTRGEGIVDLPSNHSVDQGQGNPGDEGGHDLRAGRPQRRSGKRGIENASHQAVDLRKRQGWRSGHARRSQHRD